MITIGILYFFSRAMAEGSPIFVFFTKYSQIAFGEIGLIVFFALCIVTGIMILIKGHLAKFLLKYFFVLLMLISAVLNVRLWDATTPIKRGENGGYFSRPLIWLLEQGLNNET